MGSEGVRLHPQALDVLREVAANRDSVLLRVERRAVHSTLEQTSPTVGPDSTGLATAEQHLVAAYREELAFALRQAAWHRLAGCGLGRRLILRRRSAEHSAAVPEAGEVQRSASIALRPRMELSGYDQELDLLERCVAAPPARWARSEDLCAAAHRLVPTDRGRLIAASALVLRGRPVAALDTLAPMLAQDWGGEDSAAAWNNAAGCLEQLDAPRRTVQALRRACRYHPGAAAYHVNRLVAAVVAMDPSEATDAMSRIDELATGNADVLSESVSRLVYLRDGGHRSAAFERHDLVRSLMERSSGPCRRILDALG